MSTLSIVPHHYDLNFIAKQAGVGNHYGWESKADGQHFRYLASDYDAVVAAIEAYPTSYRSVMVPPMLHQVATMRDQRVQSFTFNGLPVSLNDKTIANLTAATVGLERNPDVPAINWAITKDTFVTIPRDMMLAMADAAFNHVQACFTAQMTIANEVKAAATVDDLRAIDLNAHPAWPA